MSSKLELLEVLRENFLKIEKIAFVFESSNTLFVDELTFFNDDNRSFIIDLIKEFNIIEIDFLACNILNDKNWTDYSQILKDETQKSI